MSMGSSYDESDRRLVAALSAGIAQGRYEVGMDGHGRPAEGSATGCEPTSAAAVGSTGAGVSRCGDSAHVDAYGPADAEGTHSGATAAGEMPFGAAAAAERLSGVASENGMRSGATSGVSTSADAPLDDFTVALNAYRAAKRGGDADAIRAAERHLQEVTRAELIANETCPPDASPRA